MDLKVIHITRKRLDRKEADVRALWENVLKPKWEKRFRARAEELVTEVMTRITVLRPNSSYKILIITKENSQDPQGGIRFPYAVLK
jgi:hypothetical protein